MDSNLQWSDWLVVALYLIAVLAFGIWVIANSFIMFYSIGRTTFVDHFTLENKLMKVI